MALRLRDAITNLSAVTATGAGAAIKATGAPGATITVKGASVTSGGTVKVQGCFADSNGDSASADADWYDLATVAVSASGTTVVTVDEPHDYLRTNVTARTDGTYTTKCKLWDGVR